MSYDRSAGTAFSDTEKQYLLQLCRDSDQSRGDLGSGGKGHTFGDLAIMMSMYFYPDHEVSQYTAREIYDEIVADPSFYERTSNQRAFSSKTKLNWIVDKQRSREYIYYLGWSQIGPTENSRITLGIAFGYGVWVCSLARHICFYECMGSLHHGGWSVRCIASMAFHTQPTGRRECIDSKYKNDILNLPLVY
jgi:hypothetical protein